ncbi:hypothetical protein JTE90_001814 [Oedothorax gibbosus]|uniref:Translation machinery-associated protein 16 n=1 Tax=Oedothorax gibbosus TaxID=931172 RepID=A0AAV6VQS5_9ARAC|nr:hypothetical protein JTE90_001814 [Oedothorax gibbosus]
MPKVKSGSKVIHPNSRKASQLSREEHRGLKLDRRKRESDLRMRAKLRKLRWFRDNVDQSKGVYTSEEVHELIEKYLQRFSEEDKKLEEQRSIKGRRFQERLGHEYKTKFAIEREKTLYETPHVGIEVPNLTTKAAFEFLIKWNGESNFVPAIDMVTVSKLSKK